jgi:hypothetical protein
MYLHLDALVLMSFDYVDIIDTTSSLWMVSVDSILAWIHTLGYVDFQYSSLHVALTHHLDSLPSSFADDGPSTPQPSFPGL